VGSTECYQARDDCTCIDGDREAALCTYEEAMFAPKSINSFSERFEHFKKVATKEQLYAFLFDLPKGGDLHNHLDGLSFPEWWFRVATDKTLNGGKEFYTRLQNMNCQENDEPFLSYLTIRESTYNQLSVCGKSEYAPLASLSEEQKRSWLSSLKLDTPDKGRDEFFEVIFPRLRHVRQDLEIITELLVENMKQFGAEGVRYIETIMTPFNFRDANGNSIAPETVACYFRERLNQPDALATGVIVRFQVYIMRFAPDAQKQIEDAYAFVAQHQDLWVGVNLVGREDNEEGHPLRFLETFRKMRRTYSGINLSIHAGEADEPNDYIRNTLLLGATRIGHGINLISDPDTMLLMRNNKYLVEINLISNRLLEYVPDLSFHPFPEYLRTGLPVCLNTDDRGMWDSNMTDEYYTAVTLFNLSWNEIVQMGKNSLEYSFAEPEMKAKLLTGYESNIAKFAQKYLTENWQEKLCEVQPISSGYSEKNFGIKFEKPQNL
jgi:adenosine deaminase CECR1